MRKIKPFSVRDIATLSREDMQKVSGGTNDRYYTSCSPLNYGASCIYEQKTGICEYTVTYDSNGNVEYYDTFCKV